MGDDKITAECIITFFPRFKFVNCILICMMIKERKTNNCIIFGIKYEMKEIYKRMNFPCKLDNGGGRGEGGVRDQDTPFFTS